MWNPLTRINVLHNATDEAGEVLVVFRDSLGKLKNELLREATAIKATLTSTAPTIANPAHNPEDPTSPAEIANPDHTAAQDSAYLAAERQIFRTANPDPTVAYPTALKQSGDDEAVAAAVAAKAAADAAAANPPHPERIADFVV